MTFWHEHRIVTETILSGRLNCYVAFNHAFKHIFFIINNQGDGCTETCAAVYFSLHVS